MGAVRALAAYGRVDGYRHVVSLDADYTVRKTFFSGRGIGNDRLAVFTSASHIAGRSLADDIRQHAAVADGDGCSESLGIEMPNSRCFGGFVTHPIVDPQQRQVSSAGSPHRRPSPIHSDSSIKLLSEVN